MTESGDLDSGQFGLTAVVAMAQGGVIGRDGDMPWRLSSDLRRFKELTMGGVLIMGRKTYDSIGRPLPGRTTIVITRNDQWAAEGVIRVGSPEAAVAMLADRAKLAGRQGFVVGGAEIYRQLLPFCQRLMLTRVLAEVDGDTKLDLDLSGFDELSRSEFPKTERDEFPTEFVVLIRTDS